MGNLPREDLIKFIECDTGITGEPLAGKILGCLHDYKVDMTQARGQAYDGAGNMSGATRGTAAQYPLAIILHCASHCLNLAAAKCLQNTCKYF